MATVREEEVEYESDPEEAKRSLTMRRREASDEEEEEEEEEEGGERPPRRIDSRSEIESDGESDGPGAPAGYYDEESEIEEEEEVEEDEDEEEAVEGEECEVSGGKDGGEVSGQIEVVAAAAAAGVVMVSNELEGDIGRSMGESTELQGVNPVEEEKKENEPFAVPTAGAFYMHDDRFRDNAGGRQTRHRYFHRSHM